MAGQRFFVQQLLRLVGKLVAAENPAIPDPRRISGGLGAFELLFQHRLAEPVELQGKKQDFGGNIRHLFLQGLEKSADFGIGNMGRVQQMPIAHHPAQALGDFFVARNSPGQSVSVEALETPFEGFAELFRFTPGPGDVSLQLRRFRPAVKIVQIPVRQIAALAFLPGLVSPGFGHLLSFLRPPAGFRPYQPYKGGNDPRQRQ